MENRQEQPIHVVLDRPVRTGLMMGVGIIVLWLIVNCVVGLVALAVFLAMTGGG